MEGNQGNGEPLKMPVASEAPWQGIASQRYRTPSPLFPDSNPKNNLFLISAPHPAQSLEAVVKYLPATSEGCAERDYTIRYSHQGIDPKLYRTGEVDGGIELVMAKAFATLNNGFVVQHRFNTQEKQLLLAGRIANLLLYLENEGAVHGDVKPANIFLYQDGISFDIRLGDFGHTQSLADYRKMLAETGSICGTVGYNPPELYGIRRKGMHSGSNPDIYGYGAVLYYLMTKQNPPTSADDQQQISFMVSGAYRRSFLQLPSDTLPAFRKLIDVCTRRKPEYRPQSFKEVLALLDKAA